MKNGGHGEGRHASCADGPRDRLQEALQDALLDAMSDVMSDVPPDRLSTDPTSPHYDAALLERGVGVRFKGVDRSNVEEYCVSEGWVRLSVGTTRDRRGRPLTIKLAGPVEPYFRRPAGTPDAPG